MELQFRDAALNIYSSTDGQLDIDADAEVEITAPIVDIDASTEVNIDSNVVPLRADFYPDGWTLARSSKAVIKSCGKTIINYKDCTYISPWEIYDRLGQDALNDIENWEIEEEMEWTIVKHDGEWVTTFTHLTECPFRTKVKC